jgi:DNA-directed RNA polymerase specialized sigma24 family protein
MRTETSPAARPPADKGAKRREEEPIDVEALYARYLNAVFAYVFSRVPYRSEAEDITSETFLAALVGSWESHARRSRRRPAVVIAAQSCCTRN